MLVVLLVIKVTTVLLDGVDAELGGINLLDTQVVGLELAADLAARIAVLIRNADGLEVGALHDVIPLGVGFTVVGLGLSTNDVLLEGIEGTGSEHGDLVPGGLGLGGELAKLLLERLDPGLSIEVEAEAGGAAKDLLILETDGRGGSAQKQGGGGSEPHDDGDDCCNEDSKWIDDVSMERRRRDDSGEKDAGGRRAGGAGSYPGRQSHERR
jgi:hypothetical protein